MQQQLSSKIICERLNKGSEVKDFIRIIAVIISAIFLIVNVPLQLVLLFDEPVELTAIKIIITMILLYDFIENLKAYRHIRARASQYASGNSGFRERFLLFADAVAIIPFDIILFYNPLALIKLIKIFRAADYLRLLRVKLLRGADYFFLALLVLYIPLLSHIFACGWLVLETDYKHADDLTKYLNGLYWSVQTLATVGYGDHPSKTNAQIIYNIVVMLFGVGTYGWILGNVANILSKRDPAKMHYMDNMSRLRAIVRNRGLSDELQNKIREYYEYVWENRLGGFEEEKFLTGLPQGLRSEAEMELKKHLIEKISLINHGGEDFIKAVALYLHHVIYTPEEYIFRAGDTGREMFFLIRGRLEVLDKDGRHLAYMSDGDFFGEIALFEGHIRSATVKSVSYSELYVLDQERFNQALAAHPDIGDKFRETALERMKNK